MNDSGVLRTLSLVIWINAALATEPDPIDVAFGAQAVNRSCGTHSSHFLCSTKVTNTNGNPVASLAFLVWDIIITIGDEVRLPALQMALADSMDR